MEVSPRAKRKAVIFLVSAGAILWIPTAGLFFGRTPGFLRGLGFVSGPPGTPFAWALALAVAVAYAAYAVRNNPVVRQHWREVSVLKFVAVLIAFAAAVVEEAVFRRLLMDWVLGNGGGAVLQVLATGLIFGGAHGIWGIVTGRFIIGFGTMLVTGILGAALGVVYLVGERSLAPPIVAHFIVTATIQPGIAYAVFSGQFRPQAVTT